MKITFNPTTQKELLLTFRYIPSYIFFLCTYKKCGHVLHVLQNFKIKQHILDIIPL